MSLIAMFLPINKTPKSEDIIFHQIYGYGKFIIKYNFFKNCNENWYIKNCPRLGTISMPIKGNGFYQKCYKLFLCNTEFEVGEKVINIITGNTKKFRNIRLLSTINYVKIIGEISPEATFVKHKDTFNEYELWWYSIDHKFIVFKVNENNIMDESFSKNPDKYIKICKVKGSCGCFH